MRVWIDKTFSSLKISFNSPDSTIGSIRFEGEIKN